MAKFLIVLCIFIACAAAKPGLLAPLAAPLAAAPLAYANLPLDAAYASSRLDINQRFAGAFVPTVFAAAPAKLVASAPLAAPAAAPLVAAPAKLVAPAPVAAPLTTSLPGPLAYTNLPLNAAHASSRIDINQRYAAAFVPIAFAAAAPAKLVASAPLTTSVAVPLAAPAAAAPAKLVAPAPVAAPLAAPLAYTNLPLDAAYASNRLDINQRYAAAFAPTTFAAGPAKLVAAAPVSAPVAAPRKLIPSTPVAAALAVPAATPLAYSNLPLDAAYASNRLDINQKYTAAFVPSAFTAPLAKLVPSVTPVATVSFAAPIASVAPLKYTAAAPALW